MPLQLRVVATGQIIEVPNEGQTIGREGGQADIQLQDGSLSSRHARIFADGMEWLIQDLGSTNGTYLGETRISATTEIHPSDVISMSTTQLEVIKIWDPQLQHTVMVAAPVFETQPVVAAVSRTPAAKSPSPVIVVTPSSEQEEELDAPTARTLISKAVRPAVQEEEPVVPSAPTMIGQAGMTAEELENANAPAAARTMIGYGAEPSAPTAAKTMIGYGAVPSAPAAARTMIGYGPSTVSVEENEEATPRPAQAEEEPAGDVGEPQASAVDAGGTDKGVKYFLVAVPKAIAFYLAAIPLMIVNPMGSIRKGVEEQKHEAKGKMELIAYALPVNLFSAAVGFISTLIVQLVTGTLSIGGLIVGTLLIPAIVAVVMSVITGYAWHPVTGWLIGKLKGESDERSRTNYFLMFMTATALVVLPSGIGTLLSLVPFRLVAMVQPILSALGSVVLVFVTYSWMTKFEVVKWFRTVLLVLGGLAIVGGAFGALGRLTTAPGGVVGSDVNAQIAAAQKQADEAMKASAEATDDAQDAVKEANAAVNEAEVAAKEAEADVKVAAKEAAPAAAEGSVTYPAYVKMRDAVEKTIADDPALLNRSPELLALYRGYTKAAFEVDSKFDELDAKNPADTKLNVRLREAELFAKNEKAITALYARLKPSGKAEAPAAAAKEEKPAVVAKEEKPKPAPVAKEEKPKPAPVAKEEKPKPAPVAKEEKPKPAPVAKEEKPKPAPVAKEEKPKAEPKPAPAAKEEKPKAAEAKPAGKGKLACSSKPTQADIWVDGKNTGKKTPLAVSSALELPAGKHTVIFKLNGKSSAPQEIVIEAGGQVVLKGVEIPGA